MRRFVLLALLVVPGSLASQGVADEPGIYGYVLAPGGIPVSNGTVVYLSFAASASTSIDGIGRFRIPVDRAGLYRVTVSVPGFAPYQFRATVPASRMLRLPVIHLKPATYFRVRFVSPPVRPSRRRRSTDARSTGAALRSSMRRTRAQSRSTSTGRRGLDRCHTASRHWRSTRRSSRRRASPISPSPARTRSSTADRSLFSRAPRFTSTCSMRRECRWRTTSLCSKTCCRCRRSSSRGPCKRMLQGRVTFERLAAGRYRVRTAAVGSV